MAGPASRRLEWMYAEAPACPGRCQLVRPAGPHGLRAGLVLPAEGRRARSQQPGHPHRLALLQRRPTGGLRQPRLRVQLHRGPGEGHLRGGLLPGLGERPRADRHRLGCGRGGLQGHARRLLLLRRHRLCPRAGRQACRPLCVFHCRGTGRVRERLHRGGLLRPGRQALPLPGGQVHRGHDDQPHRLGALRPGHGRQLGRPGHLRGHHGACQAVLRVDRRPDPRRRGRRQGPLRTRLHEQLLHNRHEAARHRPVRGQRRPGHHQRRQGSHPPPLGQLLRALRERLVRQLRQVPLRRREDRRHPGLHGLLLVGCLLPRPGDHRRWRLRHLLRGASGPRVRGRLPGERPTGCRHVRHQVRRAARVRGLRVPQVAHPDRQQPRLRLRELLPARAQRRQHRGGA